ncbi:MAG: hypothetical protein OXU77_14090 [Gammaproteobacteria bacterium]|nr:hypothetical protein [Gammaproteobacteria bacterium]MDE0442685.1 hypothetical protein [Gammaproteobacteria bacterium]
MPAVEVHVSHPQSARFRAFLTGEIELARKFLMGDVDGSAASQR